MTEDLAAGRIQEGGGGGEADQYFDVFRSAIAAIVEAGQELGEVRIVRLTDGVYSMLYAPHGEMLPDEPTIAYVPGRSPMDTRFGSADAGPTGEA